MAEKRDNLAGREADELLRMHNYLADMAKLKPATPKSFKTKAILAAKVRELRKVVPTRIVRVAAETMLLQDKPTLTYEEILERVIAEFECATSIACLRWYAVRMRERGEKLPARPRSGSK